MAGGGGRAAGGARPPMWVQRDHQELVRKATEGRTQWNVGAPGTFSLRRLYRSSKSKRLTLNCAVHAPLYAAQPLKVSCSLGVEKITYHSYSDRRGLSLLGRPCPPMVSVWRYRTAW